MLVLACLVYTAAKYSSSPSPLFASLVSSLPAFATRIIGIPRASLESSIVPARLNRTCACVCLPCLYSTKHLSESRPRRPLLHFSTLLPCHEISSCCLLLWFWRALIRVLSKEAWAELALELTLLVHAPHDNNREILLASRSSHIAPLRLQYRLSLNRQGLKWAVAVILLPFLQSAKPFAGDLLS